MKSKENSNPSPHPRQAFMSWYRTTNLGQTLQKAEASYLSNALQLTYNQKTLQVGALFSEYSYIPEEFRRNFVLLSSYYESETPSLMGAWTFPDELPIATASIDTLILPHLLEFEDTPRAILGEVERVLKPAGQVHILGLNPWSFDGVFRRFPPFQGDMRDRLITCQRLIDWLELLKIEAEWQAGFDYTQEQTILTPNTLFQRSLAHLSAAYAIRAIKRTHTLIPIKSHWIETHILHPERALETSTGLYSRETH